MAKEVNAIYKIEEGGMHDRFHQSRAKIQFLGGGFGNGKTACAVIKALKLAVDYPGSNGLIARSTFPKLNDTIRKEFFKWCPKAWIKRMPTEKDNTCILKNGTMVNFRYMAQRGKETEQTTSNLLSATFDWAVVDQIEDPEFTHKDFMDLMGRLRGSTEYNGNDPTMPREGPRWLILTSNPTRNWVYRKLIKPLHDYNRGIINKDLLVQLDENSKPVMVDGRPVPMIELFEGSTYENVANVGIDFINGMLSSFTNQSMRDRFIMGKWGALSGVVYHLFDEDVHTLTEQTVVEYLMQLRSSGYEPNFFEGYDHGLMRPSCYGLFFCDDEGNVFLIDGFYAPEQTIATSAELIKQIRATYGISEHESRFVYSDPQLFNRTTGSTVVVGTTVAELFRREGIEFQRGNKDITAGISKNMQYLAINQFHEHPVFGTPGAPHFFVSEKCDWFINEITSWFFKEETDKPIDKDDHAMDMWKYAMTGRKRLAQYRGNPKSKPQFLQWHEVEDGNTNNKRPRHR